MSNQHAEVPGMARQGGAWITVHMYLPERPDSWKEFAEKQLTPALNPLGITAHIIDADSQEP